MAWPTTAVAVGDVITASQMNGLPVRLADTTLGASAANIDFQNIPGIFAHLMLVCYLRGDTAAANTSLLIRLNNDSAGNYDYQQLFGQAATAGASEAFAGSAVVGGVVPANTATANVFAGSVIEIPHYANTANNKAMTVATAHKQGTATTNLVSYANAGFWRSNSAITRVTILPGAGNLVSGSRVTLYGLP